MKWIHNKRGFTLIELIMVIVILGILAAVAIPRFINLQDDAKKAAEKGMAGGVRAGISILHATFLLGTQGQTALPAQDTPIVDYWPDTLDCVGLGGCTVSAGATAAAGLFSFVVESGTTAADGWAETVAKTYKGPWGFASSGGTANDHTWTYTEAAGNAASGQFTCTDPTPTPNTCP